jgi:hypothetical protein
MPLVVTTNARIICAHGGQVQLVPKQQKVLIEGGFVLCEPDLVGSPIVGCPQAGPGIKPCTAIVSTIPGSTSPTTSVDGRPVYVQTLSGLTDGVPPGTIICVSPGQAVVQA